MLKQSVSSLMKAEPHPNLRSLEKPIDFSLHFQFPQAISISQEGELNCVFMESKDRIKSPLDEIELTDVAIKEPKAYDRSTIKIPTLF